MNFEEFVQKIIEYYPPEDEAPNDFLEYFLKAINLSGEYDYENAFIELMRSYRYKKTPSPGEVVKCLQNNEIKAKKKSNSEPVIGSIFADKYGQTFCYGVETNVGEYETMRWLLNHGFTNLRTQEHN